MVVLWYNVMIYARQDLSVVIILLIIKRDYSLNLILASLIFRKTTNVNVNVIEKGRVPFLLILSVIGIRN